MGADSGHAPPTVVLAGQPARSVPSLRGGFKMRGGLTLLQFPGTSARKRRGKLGRQQFLGGLFGTTDKQGVKTDLRKNNLQYCKRCRRLHQAEMEPVTTILLMTDRLSFFLGTLMFLIFPTSESSCE